MKVVLYQNYRFQIASLCLFGMMLTGVSTAVLSGMAYISDPNLVNWHVLIPILVISSILFPITTIGFFYNLSRQTIDISKPRTIVKE